MDFLDLVALSLNLRLGEALALRWEEDLDVSDLSVTLALRRVGGELSLPAALVGALKSRRTRQR